MNQEMGMKSLDLLEAIRAEEERRMEVLGRPACPQFGEFREFDHEPTPEEDAEAQLECARQIGMSMLPHADVIRTTPEDFPGSHRWTVGIKLALCTRSFPPEECRHTARREDDPDRPGQKQDERQRNLWSRIAERCKKSLAFDRLIWILTVLLGAVAGALMVLFHQ